LDSLGRPRISYFDLTNTDLKYAAYDGSAWQIETVDGAGFVGHCTSLALNDSSLPRISYHDETNGNLKYAAYNGSAWQIDTLDEDGDVGEWTSLAH
jgi:hypothetical protein